MLSEPLTLPCGSQLPNRLCKAAMTEGLADAHGVPSADLIHLYKVWGQSGAGLLLSGNVQIDADHLERPGNVIIDGDPSPALQQALSQWAMAATAEGAQFWAQISHAGRQCQKAVNPRPKAPSAVKLGLPGGQFGEPEALTVGEIEEIVNRFAVAAAALKEAGFNGVQIHAAHGYLISQFLSPRSNQREDQYGGSLENRARILLDALQAVRLAVGPEFPVSVKLNSADFQKGGFAFEDSLQVAQWLEQHGVDLIEISGGTYEQPKLLGVEGVEVEEKQNLALSTQKREAYFVDFAKAMHEKVTVPLMVTGGFRLRSAMESALASGGADLIGLGRPMCIDTDAPLQLLKGCKELRRYEDELALLPPWLSFLQTSKTVKTMATFSVQYWFYAQLDLLGKQGAANPELSVWAATRRLMSLQKAQLKARAKSRA
jgi:2,4-dienoyl-CoA reductase-like NADH-dependent reductase (Old Yellow Enzyme family)